MNEDAGHLAGGRLSIAALARKAGLSTATVDRVLNRRGGVRQPTVDRVVAAAVALGYPLPSEFCADARRPPMRLAFVLPVGRNRYLELLAETITQSAHLIEQFNAHCHVDLIAGFNPKALADHLLKIQNDYDGVAFMALEHPLVREAVSQLAARGVHVLTLISDLSNVPRAAFVGMDNRSAGRTAGLLLGRFLGPKPEGGTKVAMFAGSLSYRGHEERAMGFRHILAESFPALDIIGSREGLDDPASNYRLARGLLEQDPDIVGIYNVGGASEGIAQALTDVKLDHRVVFIGHGLSAVTRGLLVDGVMDAVINATPQALVRQSVQVFSNLRQSRAAMAGLEPIPIGIVVAENLP